MLLTTKQSTLLTIFELLSMRMRRNTFLRYQKASVLMPYVKIGIGSSSATDTIIFLCNTTGIMLFFTIRVYLMKFLKQTQQRLHLRKQKGNLVS